jgi:hypothetical protein
MIESFFKNQRTSNESLQGSVLLLDGPGWRRPLTITIEGLNSLLNVIVNDMKDKIDSDTIIIDASTLKIKISNDLINVAQSVSGVLFMDQDISIHNPPNTYPVSAKMHLATDQNFLYVWTYDRWKRIPLHEF